MNHRHSFLLVIALILGLFNLSLAQAKSADIIIGKSIDIQSKILSEERKILIHLPDDYETTKNNYPVIYVLDGERIFGFSVGMVDFLSGGAGMMAKMIVVGIPNTDRGRDLSPNRDQSSGGDNFLKFLEMELIPFIESNYRTSPYRILYGHSLAGMFSIYALFSKPDLFSSYIAVSPALMMDNGYVIDYSKKALEKQSSLNKSIFITLGDEPGYTETIDRFINLLKTKAYDSLKWKYVAMETEDHNSIPLKALNSGLEYLFQDWILTDNIINSGADAIKAHYALLGERYGYKVTIPEGEINLIGYRLLGVEKYDQAISIFRLNAAEHPESANVYDSLGDAYEKAHQLELAKKNYETACQKGMESDHPFLRAFKENLERIQKALADQKGS